jgi:hypothetical protein
VAKAPGTNVSLPPLAPEDRELVLQAIHAMGRAQEAQIAALTAQVRATVRPAVDRSKMLAAIALLVTAVLGGGGAHSWFQTPAIKAVQEDVRAIRTAQTEQRDHALEAHNATTEQDKQQNVILCALNGAPFAEDLECDAREVRVDATALGAARYVPLRGRVVGAKWPHAPRP